MGGFCGTGTYYLTSYNQYDGTKTRLAKDVHCLAAFGEEGRIKYLPGRGEGFFDNNNTLTPRVFCIFGIIFSRSTWHEWGVGSFEGMKR